MKTLATLIAAASLAASGITIASADTTLEPRSVTVKYADLNPGNVQGAQALYQRIASAAESVCNDLKPGRQLALMERYANCVHQAHQRGDRPSRPPALTAYAAVHGIRPIDAAPKYGPQSVIRWTRGSDTSGARAFGSDRSKRRESADRTRIQTFQNIFIPDSGPGPSACGTLPAPTTSRRLPCRNS